jgi:hypothetical protein
MGKEGRWREVEHVELRRVWRDATRSGADRAGNGQDEQRDYNAPHFT